MIETIQAIIEELRKTSWTISECGYWTNEEVRNLANQLAERIDAAYFQENHCEKRWDDDGNVMPPPLRFIGGFAFWRQCHENHRLHHADEARRPANQAERNRRMKKPLKKNPFYLHWFRVAPFKRMVFLVVGDVHAAVKHAKRHGFRRYDFDGVPCADCGCRHSYVVRTEKIGEVIRRTRRCRNCGWTFYTTEAP